MSKRQRSLDGFLSQPPGKSARQASAASSLSSTGTRLVECPTCSRQVPLLLINEHLDTTCPALPAPASTQAKGKAAARPSLPGLATTRCGASSDKGPQGAPPPPAAAARSPPLVDACDPAPPLSAAEAPARDRAASPPRNPSGGMREERAETAEAPAAQGWEDILHRMQRGATGAGEYGVHTGLKGGWRARAKSSMELLDALDEPDAGACADEDGEELHRKAGVPGDSDGGSGSGSGYSSRLPEGLVAALAQTSGLPGHFVLENFITEAEEARIVQELDCDTANPWRHNTFNGHSGGKHYGVVSDLRRRLTSEPKHPLPPWLSEVTNRMREVGLPVLSKFRPNECNAIDYRRAKGHELKPHVDDRKMSGDIICNLSLCGDSIMTYQREKGHGHSVDVYLPRRSLQVQAGGVRYEYTHSISNSNLLCDRRVSVTFREVVQLDKPLYEGARYIPMKDRYKWGQKIA